MTIADEFDKKISRQGTPDHFRAAAVEANDTLEICWASARSVFGNEAKPEHAIALLPIVLKRADEKYQQMLARFGRDTESE